MAASEATEQQQHLRRVSARIEALILSFARDRLAVKRPEFHMSELTHFVGRHELLAPDSAGRVLRNMRQRGLLGYRVNRRLSLYSITKVAS